MLKNSLHAGVASLTLDRADRGNALSGELVDSLLAQVQQSLADPEVHTLVLRASGQHFCTGFDLADLDTASDGDLLLRFVRIESLLALLWHAPIRTVALAQGRTWGAGADLFATCDARVATADASFRFPGAGFGLVLGTRRLSERVGPDRARRWIGEAIQIDAPQALASGLATDVLAVGVPLPDAGDAGTGGEASPDWARLTRAPAIDRQTTQAIREASRPAALRDHDLAALVRSASAPGLIGRIARYRDAMKRAAKPGAR